MSLHAARLLSAATLSHWQVRQGDHKASGIGHLLIVNKLPSLFFLALLLALCPPPPPSLSRVRIKARGG
jgi:hypothetical protein